MLVAKGNCGIPEYRDGQICYSGTPEIMADYAAAGARLRCADHRRLLRHHGRARGRDARGCSTRASPGPRPSPIPRSPPALGPVVLPSVTGASDAERERGERRRPA